MYTHQAPTHLEVILKSGTHYQLRVDYPRGSPPNPATRDALEAKFDALVTPILPTAQITLLKERIFTLEEVGDIGELTSLLSRTS